jgi:DNA repair exonuclease SbcCD ATPase subunit
MKKVLRFIEIEFIDFKSLRNKLIKFNKDETHIVGQNESGKSTILDGINWVLTGKNALGKSKFDLYPLDKDENLIPGTEPMVRFLVELNGERIEFKRHQLKDLKYYINDVPMAAGKFKDFVSDIIDEKLFMALLNPTYFAGSMKWQDQKAIILDNFKVDDSVILKECFEPIRKDVSSAGIDASKDKYKSLGDNLDKEIQKLIGQKELKEKEIGSGGDVNKDDLIAKRDETAKTLEETEKQMDGVYPLKEKLYKLQKVIDKQVSENDKQLNDAKSKVSNLKTQKNNKMTEYKKAASDLKAVSDVCKLCGSDLDATGIATQRENIQTKINTITAEGLGLGEKIKLAELDVTTKEKLVVDQELLDEKHKLEVDIKAIEDTVDSDKIQSLRIQVRDYNDEISSYDVIAKNKESLKEIKSKLAEKTDLFDDAETLQALAKQYHQEYSELIATELNKNLTDVHIRTFKTQKNGELKETFEITRKGVPYISVNTAGKTKAGLELIKLINTALDLDFPTICDNFEGITSTIKFPHQLITLSAVKGAELSVLD